MLHWAWINRWVHLTCIKLFDFLLRMLINNLKMGSTIFFETIFELWFVIIPLCTILRFIIFIIWRHFMDIFEFVISSIIEVIILRGIIFFVKFSNLLRDHLWRRRILITQPNLLIRIRDTKPLQITVSFHQLPLIFTIYVIISILITSRLFKFIAHMVTWTHGVVCNLVDILLFWSHLFKTWPQKTADVFLFGVNDYIAFGHFIVRGTFHISSWYS